MTTDIQLSEFDYAALDAETRIVVQQRTNEIRDLTRRTAQDIIDIGRKLNDVKSRLAHGQFGAWLEAEFSWTDRTARRFMAVADKFGDDENGHIVRFAPSALYLLSTGPDEAREEALQRAEQGESITHKAAKQLVEAATPAPDYAAVNELMSRIVALLNLRGGLRYDELRDQLSMTGGLHPFSQQDKTNLRRALDTLLGSQRIKKSGAVYSIPEVPTETSQDAAKLLRFLGEMGETTFKPLRDRSGLENSRFWRAFNLLEADGKIVRHASKGGQFPTVSLAPAPASEPTPGEAAQDAQEPEPAPVEVVPPAETPAPETPVSDAPPEPAPVTDRAAILQRDRAQAAATEAQNGAAWETARTRARLEAALCDLTDGLTLARDALAAANLIRGIRSFAEVFSAEEMIATRNLILSALAAFDKTRPHLEDLIAKLDTMIETGKPYED